MSSLDSSQISPSHDVEATTPLLHEMHAPGSSGAVSSPGKTEIPTKWLILALLVIGWFVIGVTLGVLWEGWPVITAIYVMVQIITTVGYGDEIMHTQGGKLMMSAHVLFGVVIVATAVASLVSEVLEKQAELVREGLREMGSHVEGADNAEQQKSDQGKKKLINSTVIVLIFMLGGTLFYGISEPCTCTTQRKGRLVEIEGCKEGPQCTETGGEVKTWIDVFYMSVITLTTVGFGDYTPTHQSGQIFAIFWMLLGTLALGNFVAAFTEYFLESQKKLQPISKEVFDQIDKDGNGTLSKVEFRSYALVKLGFCTQEELDQVDQMFSKMDADNTGHLTFEEIHMYMDPPSPRGLA